jgi:hypothetical protein
MGIDNDRDPWMQRARCGVNDEEPPGDVETLQLALGRREPRSIVPGTTGTL